MGELKVRELHPAFGAEIQGLEPKIPLDDDTIRRLREVFDERSVLVFRDLDIDEDFQRYLVFTLVGEEPPAPGVRPEQAHRNGPMLVSNKEGGGAAPYGRLLFHCDTMWAETPQRIISLYGYEVGQPSVPTLFASMVHGWDTLPDDLRARVEGLEARHGHEHYYPNRGGDDDVIDTYYEDAQSTVTPVAHRHPRTGRTTLYVSQQVTMEILGLPQDENEELLEALFAHLYAPDNVLQHEWRTGDLVIWDNNAVQHARGTVDLEGPERTLRKVFGPMAPGVIKTSLPKFSKVSQS
jgi:alpha-ketoglutarate-dependent taurine dioxygenase